MEKIKAVKFVLTRAEGYTDECKSVERNSWKDANQTLRDWSTTAPKNGSYHKCDFRVIYADGEEYLGRYDLMHFTIETANIGRHMLEYLLLMAGLKKPHHLTDEMYASYLNNLIGEGQKNIYQKFLDKYEIIE